MSRRKNSISKAQNYEEIAEFWDTHDLSDYWEQSELVKFEIDIQGEEIYYAIEESLSKMISIVSKQRISVGTLINLWLQEELQEDQVKPVESEFITILNKKYYAIDMELSDKIYVIAKQWDVSANALVNLWLQRRIQRDSEVDTYKSNTQLPSRQYPVDRELSEKIRAIAKKRGISANTLVNLWLQKELQEQNIPIKISTDVLVS